MESQPMHWSVILFWVVVVALAVAGVAYAIHVRNRQAARKREYLDTHPEIDPHAPKGPRPR